MNLLTNARDALADAPRKMISLSSTRQQDGLTLVVHKTGAGIPKGLEQRIYDPLFTTKEVGTGTRLGLSITYGSIQEHRGTIWVERSPGEGAAFSIQLLLAQSGEVEAAYESDPSAHR